MINLFIDFIPDTGKNSSSNNCMLCFIQQPSIKHWRPSGQQITFLQKTTHCCKCYQQNETIWRCNTEQEKANLFNCGQLQLSCYEGWQYGGLLTDNVLTDFILTEVLACEYLGVLMFLIFLVWALANLPTVHNGGLNRLRVRSLSCWWQVRRYIWHVTHKMPFFIFWLKEMVE